MAKQASAMLKETADNCRSYPAPIDRPELRKLLDRAACDLEAGAAIIFHVVEAWRGDAMNDIYLERRRQIAEEGWTPEHDDQHDADEIALAASCYAAGEVVYGFGEEGRRSLIALWPWDFKWWKPKDKRRNLVRAAALLVAEIERLDRAAAKANAA